MSDGDEEQDEEDEDERNKRLAIRDILVVEAVVDASLPGLVMVRVEGDAVCLETL